MTNIIEELLKCPLTPHEQVVVTRTAPFVKEENGAEDTLTENVGQFSVFISPPDTLNKNDGAILERLMRGVDARNVYMMYGLTEGIRVGDTVKRIQTDGLDYEVRIVGHHGGAFNDTAIRHYKCYIVLKDDQDEMS